MIYSIFRFLGIINSCLYYPDIWASFLNFNLYACTFSIHVPDSFDPTVFPLKIHSIGSFMVALSWRHCNHSFYNFVSNFLFEILITDSGVDFFPMASFCINLIVLSRSFVGLSGKAISCSNFHLEENSFLLKLGKPLLHDRNKITTRLMLVWQRQYFIIFILCHFIAFRNSLCYYLSRFISKRVELFRVASFSVVLSVRSLKPSTWYFYYLMHNTQRMSWTRY